MKIMFICTGNICRSAMAHHLLEKKLEEIAGFHCEVFSCGIFAQPGEEPTHYACEVMKKYHVTMENHKACPIEDSCIEKMDLILCATNSHKEMVKQMYPNLIDKIYTMKEYAGYPKEDWDIDDPWGYDKKVYQNCLSQINYILNKLLEKIVDKK